MLQFLLRPGVYNVKKLAPLARKETLFYPSLLLWFGRSLSANYILEQIWVFWHISVFIVLLHLGFQYYYLTLHRPIV